MSRGFPSRFLAVATLAVVASIATQVTGQSGPSDAESVARLALEVERAESVRHVKRLQDTYAQYSQFGLWNEMAALFAADAELIRGEDRVKGQAAIGDYFLETFGGGQHGLPAGGLHTQLSMRPLINVSADGRTAKGRWWEWSMTGSYGGTADWAGGIYENEFVQDGGVWKFARVHYYPMIAGPYETGWRTVHDDQKIVPYHFTTDETGVPVPELPASTAVRPAAGDPAEQLAGLEQRIAAMNDEDQVRNLQNAYGYYVDRKMWDDVTDLFTADAVLEIADVGLYDGPAGIRRALERMGPAGLEGRPAQRSPAARHGRRDRTGRSRSASTRHRVRDARRRRCGHRVSHGGRLREPLRQGRRRLAHSRDARVSAHEDRLLPGLGEERRR